MLVEVVIVLDQPNVLDCESAGINPNTENDHCLKQQGNSSGNEKSKLLLCNSCNKPFETETQLTSHLCSISPSRKKFQCPKCDKSFDYSLYLPSHMKTHEEKLVLSCEICRETFSNASCLRNHKLTHGRKRFKCAICWVSCATSSALKIHENKQHKRKNYHRICRPCGKSYITQSGWENHRKYHGMGRCPQCGQYFKTTTSQFDDHMQRHITQKPFRCKICEKWFRSKSEVITHVDVDHKNKNRGLKYGCANCKKSFAMRRFFSSHRCKEMFDCRTCKDQFIKKSERNAHERDTHPTTHKEENTKNQKSLNNKPNIKLETAISEITEVKEEVKSEPDSTQSFVFRIDDADIGISDLRVEQIFCSSVVKVEPMDTEQIPQIKQEVDRTLCAAQEMTYIFKIDGTDISVCRP